MAFIKKQGYWRSENGWRMCDANELDFSPVPEIGWKVGVRIGVPNTLIKALMVRLNREVEPIDISQCGVFTATNSMPNSNHNSGTALDYNWHKHPFHAWGTWGSNRAKVEKILSDFRNTIEWGGEWTNPRDEMHFELRYGEDHQGAIDLAHELYEGGLWGIFKPGPHPVPGPTLPGGDDYLQLGDHGDDVLVLQQELNRVFPRYKATPIIEDGAFGPSTESAVREFQSRANIGVDGIVGAQTRAALKANGVNLDRPPAFVSWVKRESDRALLEYVAEQLGPGHPDWASAGQTLRDKVWEMGDDA